MTKVVAYIRVSYRDQQKGYSPETQRQILQDYAQGHDLEIVKTFASQESAYRLGREEFSEMISYLEKHRTIRGVLVYKVDRSSRNMYDYGYLVDKLGIRIISVTEQFPDNAAGRWMADQLAATARFYSAQIGENSSRGMKTKAKQGLYPTYAPLGYVNVTRGDRKVIEIDPVVGPMVRDLFIRYARTDDSLSTLTSWALQRGLRSRYGNPMHKSALHKLLQNPVYYGDFVWRGELHHGTHEALIERSLFDAVQAKLEGRGAPRVIRREFPYRGLVFCGYCGHQLTAEMKKGRYVYYHCTTKRSECPQPYYSQDRLGERLREVLEQVRLTQENADELFALVIKDNETAKKERAARKIQLRAEEQRITERMDAMYEDRLDGTISEEEWLRRDRQQTTRLNMVREELRRLNPSGDFEMDDVRTIIELAQRLPERYMRQSHEERALVLKALISNCVMTSESVDPVYKEPFAAIAKWRRSPAWLPGEDSNLQPFG